MIKTRYGDTLRHLHTLFNLGTVGGLTDGQLLDQFTTCSGEAAELAFAALVERHGPMVLRVCRSVLQEPHDAQDAFQATFLILVRKACSIRKRDSLASWLHGVACRTAACARAANARRQRHERRVAANAVPSVADGDPDELASVLHEELERLPDKYRAPIILCYLESLTHEQAAQKLRWPVGTVRSRLARTRLQLRGRLLRRGLVLSVGSLDAVMSSNTALAALPAALASLTVRAGMRYFTARLVTNGINSASVSSLLEGAIKAMFLTKLKFAVVASGLIATGAVVVAQQSVNISESISRPARSAVTESYSATPAAPSDTATDDVTVARELRRLDIDLLAEEVEQLRTQVELTLRDKLRVTRRISGTAGGGQWTRARNPNETESAYESARSAYLAKSRELRSARRQLEETTESRQASIGNSRGISRSGDDRTEDRASGKSESHPIGAAIGSIDIAAVFDRYEKARQSTKQYTSSINAERERLNELMDQIKALVQQTEKAAPNSSDFTILESRIVLLKQQHESLREVLEREFSQRQARYTASLLEEIEQAIASVAKAKGLNYVVKVSPGLKPDSGVNDVMTALSRSVLYADPRNDLTEEVVSDLNQKFRAGEAKKSKSQ